jgi:hypothetical protein
MIQNAVVEIAGYEVIISASDYERVMAYKWRKAGIKRGTYFRRSYYDKEAGKKKEMFLHRFLANCQHGKQIVDHISGNTLDNRQENLRICTITENNRNCHKNKRNTSGYKGVHWNKEKRKWKAAIKVNRKLIFLGLFDDLEEAYEAYVAASKKYHGEFGRLA